ncbi:MAG: YkgJ family cysteine cluster protein [Nautiliaceae bacterium]
MYANIKHLHLLKFNNCENCTECCKNKFLAPLVLDDFEKVCDYFPIVIAKLEVFKPVMLLSTEKGCPYLQNDKCSIYEQRPPACKIYPFSPWYDSILLDLSCPGVGTQGLFLPLTKKEFCSSSFFDERVINIKQKLINTAKWLENKKITPIGSVKNIEIFQISNPKDKYDLIHKKSLKFLKNYENLIKKPLN